MLYFFWVDDCTKDVISAGGSAISKVLVIKSCAELFFIKHNLRFGPVGPVGPVGPLGLVGLLGLSTSTTIYWLVWLVRLVWLGSSFCVLR